MASFEKQNKPQGNINKKKSLGLGNSFKEESNIGIHEEHRKQAQVDLHESLTCLRKLSEGEVTLPNIKNVLGEEVERLEGIGKYTEHLYGEYKKVKEEARIDTLTKLPNRRAFEEVLKTKIERAKNDSAELYMLYIDIDKFKEVNDIYGHDAGDEYLRLISSHITDELRPDDMIARLGGDEFAVTIFLRNPRETSGEPFDHREESDAIATRIYHAVRLAKSQLYEKVSADNKKNISKADFLSSIASIGGVRFDGKQDADLLMKKADEMMYEIKNSGKSGIGWDSEEGAKE